MYIHIIIHYIYKYYALTKFYTDGKVGEASMDSGKANNSENSDSDASTSDDDVQSNDMVSSIICM